MLNLGPTEIILISIVFLVVVVVPIALIGMAVYFAMRGGKSNSQVKKCAFCGYAVPVAATVCQYCGRDLVTPSKE